MKHEHLWIEGPELPRRYGTCLSRICTECGIYELYDWCGGHLSYDYYIDSVQEWEEMENL